MAEQQVLPIPAITRCGYCLRNLVLQPAGNWACPRCKPLLAEVKDEWEWLRFHRDASRDRVKPGPAA